ncbi:MAG: ABC transporter permease [Terracidiphilus sp.]
MQPFGKILSRRRRCEDLAASIREHLEEKVNELVEQGISRQDAEVHARREFGNVALIEQHSREVWQWPAMENLWADLRFAWRQAARSPRFTIAAIATLAIGIGAQAAMYSVIHAVLIDPYPYRDAMRMVHLHLYDKDPFPDDLALTGPQFAEFEKSPVLDGAVAEDVYSMALTREELPEQVQVGRLSPNAFEYFGVPAELGRGFASSDSSRVAVLSYRFWKSHYAGSADAIGKPLQLNHESYTILGVMPPRFAWMGSDAYIPLAYSPDPRHIANVYARIRAGVSDEAAEQALEPMLDRFAKETPGNFPQKFKVHLVHINEIAIGRFKGVLVILFISVSFLLVLACVNVAILLLARGEARQAEMAMRKALGAGRRRIVGQLLTESLLLSSAGGGCGVLLALGGIRLVRYFLVPLPTLFPPEADIALNIPVLLFSAGVSTLTGVACGLWPAVRMSRADLRQAADAGAHRFAGRRGTQKIHMALLASQVAITILLLACSGATVRRLLQLMHASLGFDPENVSSVNLVLREGSHDRWADRVQYYEQIRQAVASDTNVVSAAIGNLPPSILDSTPVSIPALHGASGHVVAEQVSPEYFGTLRIPLLRGRVWSAAETAHAARLALINEAMWRRYWPSSDAIGQTIVLNNGVASGTEWKLVAPGDNQRFLIVGEVGDSPNQGLDEQISPAVYVPYTMTPYDGFDLVLRTRGDPAGALHSIKEDVHRIDAGQAVGEMTTASDMLDGSLGRERFVAGLFTVFAFLGLAFAVSGLYCVQSYLVAQRTSEFGVRIALGARRLHIVRLVTNSTFAALLAGAGIGFLLNFALSRIFADWTNGNSRDPAMLGAIFSILLVAAGAASIAPALAATAIAPMKALRSE